MKKLVLFLVLVGVGLTGIALWINFPRARGVTEKIFTYSEVEKGNMVETISATGVIQIEPGDVLVVSSEMPGTVVGIRGKVNDRVAEGTVLARLDDRKVRLKLDEAQTGVKTAEAALAQAQSALAQAEAMHKAAQLGLQFQTDIEGRGGFRSERDQAEVKVKAASAGVEAASAGVKLARSKLAAAQIAAREAELALDQTKVKVPRLSQLALARNDSQASDLEPARPYVIMDRKLQLGQQVGPGGNDPLFVLARDLDRLDVHAQVAEGDIGKVKKGLAASFTVTAFSDENIEFTGKVREIRPMPSNLKGAIFYDTVVAVENQKDAETGEWRLRPGMTAAVDIVRRRHNHVWKVPSAALNFQMEDAYQSEAAREHILEWRQRPDQASWKPVWIWDKERSEPWPVFVRIGGVNKDGEPGVKDSGFNEVLEWEPGREPDGTPMRVITTAPPAHAPGIFDRPANIKVS